MSPAYREIPSQLPRSPALPVGGSPPHSSPPWAPSCDGYEHSLGRWHQPRTRVACFQERALLSPGSFIFNGSFNFQDNRGQNRVSHTSGVNDVK